MIAIKSPGTSVGVKIIPAYQQFAKGSGYSTRYTISNISNGDITPEFNISYVQTSRPAKITSSDGKAVYSDAYPHLETNRITVDRVEDGAVVLSAQPHFTYTCDIQIHFYYAIILGGSVKNYFYNGVLLNIEEKDSYTPDGKNTVDVINYFTELDIDVDGTLGSNSDRKVPSQRAVREYVKNTATVLWNDRGGIDASTGKYPVSGGSGKSGLIRKGDIWTVTVSGTLGEILVHVGDTVRAMTDSPGQIHENWCCLESNLGYTAVTDSRTVNGKTLSSDITLMLASSDFANQGKKTTVLHGNEDGNPTFGLVDLTSEVTGILPVTSHPELKGDVLTSPGDTQTTIATNAITDDKFRQSKARSVVGNATNSTNNVTDIQGIKDQVLRVDGTGTGISFGQIDLSKSAAVTGLLAASSFPVLSGDVSNPGGSTSISIGAGKVTNTMLAGAVTISKGGTGQTTSVAAKDALTVISTDISSGGTTDLSTATGEYVTITGTATITSLGIVPAGAERVLRFTGAATLVHSPTAIILPGNANIIVAPGDRAIFRSLGSNSWICVCYIRSGAVPPTGTNTGDQFVFDGGSA